MGYRSLQERRIAAARLMDEGEAWVAPWSQSLRAQIGGVLVDCLMEVATVKRSMKDESGNKVEEEQGAFFHTYEHLKGQRLGVIKLNPEIADRQAFFNNTITLPNHRTGLHEIALGPLYTHDISLCLSSQSHGSIPTMEATSIPRTMPCDSKNRSSKRPIFNGRVSWDKWSSSMLD